MKSPFKRRTALAAVLLAPALAACGFDVQTDQIYQAAQGVNDRSGDVWILNALVVAAQDGSGTFAGSLDNQTGSGQTLTGVTGTSVTVGASRTAIAGHQLVNLSSPTVDGLPQLPVTGTGVKVGGFVSLTFTFSGGGSTTVKVPVVSTDSVDGSEFKDVPLPVPSPTAPVATAAG